MGRPLTTPETLALGLLLDEAAGAAVVMFVAHHERKLGESERQIRDLMNSVADCLLVVDREGNITTSNSAAKRMFGLQTDDLIGHDFRAIAAVADEEYPENAPDRPFAWPPAAEAELPLRLQTRGRHSDGSRFHLELCISRFQRGDDDWWIVMARDITPQKRLEAELIARARELTALNQSLARLTQEAEAANRAKSIFLANISHEIRTPMTAILGYVELLQMDLSDPQHLDACETIKRNSNYLVQLINDLLDLSKIEARKFEVLRAPTGPVEAVNEVHSLMSLRAAGKGLPLITEYVGEIPETISSDPKRLRQILINLVGNCAEIHGPRAGANHRTATPDRAGTGTRICRQRYGNRHRSQRPGARVSSRSCKPAAPVGGPSAGPGSASRSASIWPRCWAGDSNWKAARWWAARFAYACRPGP